jgi:hypothetical protein
LRREGAAVGRGRFRRATGAATNGEVDREHEPRGEGVHGVELSGNRDILARFIWFRTDPTTGPNPRPAKPGGNFRLAMTNQRGYPGGCRSEGLGGTGSVPSHCFPVNYLDDTASCVPKRSGGGASRPSKDGMMEEMGRKHAIHQPACGQFNTPLGSEIGRCPVSEVVAAAGVPPMYSSYGPPRS